MNITFVSAGIVPIHSDLGGGIERHFRAVTTRLAARGHDVTIVDRQYDDDDPMELDGVNVVRVSVPMVDTGLLDGWADHVLNEMLYAACLGRVAETIEDSDVVHAHNMYTGLRTMRLARNADTPFVYTVQNGMWCADDVNAYEKHVVRRGEGRLVRGADRAFAVSSAVADSLRVHTSADVTPLHNGVDVSVFTPDVDAEEVRREYDLGEDRIVLFVGRLVEAKGVDVLVRAARRVLEESDEDVTFVLVGPDKHMYGGSEAEGYSAKVHRLIKEVGIEDSVVFTGELDDDALRQLYATADVFTLPSRFEAQGMVVLEAMASGTPVVGSSVGGIPEMLSDSYATTVPPGDPDALATALLPYLTAEDTIEMEQAARATAVSEFSWDAVTDRLEETYRELL